MADDTTDEQCPEGQHLDPDTGECVEDDADGAAAIAAVAALAALIGDDVDKALADDNEEHRVALLSALAVTAFTLAYQDAGGTGSSAEEARAYAFSLRPAFGLLEPDGSDAQRDRIVDIIAHSATNAATLAAAADNARAAGGDGAVSDLKFEWRTQRDEKVRDLHRPVDGQMRAGLEPFDVGGHPQRYPGHPVGPPEAWINCRCYLITHGATTAATDPIPEPGLEQDPAPEPHTGIAVVARPKDPAGLAVDGGDPADDLHVTLGFFGNTDNPDLSPDLRERLQAYVDENPLNPHAAHVGGVAYMGDDDPQALALLLESGDLAEARTALEQYATPDSLHPHFTPHMTLGYGMPMPQSHPTDIDLSHTELWWGGERTGGPEMPDLEADALVAREFDTAKRKQMAKAHTAMPDGSFPIANAEDLKNAIQAIGRAKNPDAVKAHIRRRARALGLSDLIPDSWTASAEGQDSTDNGTELTAWAKSTSPPGTHDAPGWITNPRETERLRTYWSKGEGAAKIRWGQPGDFDRCRKQLAKYIPEPTYLAGTCANLHFVALGFWPNQGPHAGKHGKTADGSCAECQDFDPDNTTPEGAAVTAAFSAAAELDEAPPPREWFADPHFDGPTALTVTDEGEVLGHIGTWDQCHVGYGDSCVPPPHSTRDYNHFRTGYVVTAGGDVAVGNLTLGTGHADPGIGAAAAVAHYDNTGTAVADVAAGEDTYGIWVHGMLRPGITKEQVHALRAGTVSGDWRTLGGKYEMVAALVVNVPGFPIPRPHETLAAGGQPLSLVAAGIVVPDPNAIDVDRIAIAIVHQLDERERRTAARARSAALRSQINGPRVAELIASVEAVGS